MKKKIFFVCLAVCLAALAIGGGSLAFFHDTETASNVFTVGRIDIALHEANREGTADAAYQAWLSEQTLLPAAETMEGNFVDKIITVENTGENDAYIWIEIWIPAILDGKTDAQHASLHYNYHDGQDYVIAETVGGYLGSKEIENVTYNGYLHFVKDSAPVKSGACTPALLDSVYMDMHIVQCAEHEGCLILADGVTHYSGSWDLVIHAVGMQADGFASVDEAISTYYGLDVASRY